MVAHDLRDPLSSLNLSLLVLKKLLPTETREAAAPTLGSIDRAVAQISGLVKALLELAVIEAGSLKLSLHPTSVVQVLDDCIEVLSPLATEKNIRLALQASPGSSMVKADRDQLLQVCSNLIGNAIKFTPDGGSIKARLREGSKTVTVEVEDSGPGIAPDDLPHVFDQFYRAREVKKRGVGLGLAIAKGIIDAHRGMIGVRSQAGHGATFWFTIPKT
jgi:signal transduction histidine kinase